MIQVAAHLVDHVFPIAPVRQWVLSFPKRIRYFLHHNPEIVSSVLNILITATEKQLILSCSKDSSIPKGSRLGAITFIQRFGKALNPHFHFHSCIIDGVFDKEGKFYPIKSLNFEEIQSIQENVRKRILKLFLRHQFLDSEATSDMLDWENSGFSLNANVRIAAHDREGLERLLRYCARPAFSGERLDRVKDKIRYLLPKPTPDGRTTLLLQPQELMNKLAQLIPPPKRHRHHYHGVLAPNSPLRAKITSNANKGLLFELATRKEELPFLLPEASLEKSGEVLKTSRSLPSPAEIKTVPQEPEKKKANTASLYRWAVLMARIFEFFPLRYGPCALDALWKASPLHRSGRIRFPCV